MTLNQAHTWAEPDLYILADEDLIESSEKAVRRLCPIAKHPEPVLVPHWSDEGIEHVMAILAERDIARPVARVRPIAGYRFKWKGRLARLRDSLGAGTRT